MTDNLSFGGFPPILMKGQKKPTEETKTRQYQGKNIVDISKILEKRRSDTPFLPVGESGISDYLDQQPLESDEIKLKHHKTKISSKPKSKSRVFMNSEPKGVKSKSRSNGKK